MLVLVVSFLSRCFFIAQIELLAAAICTRVTKLQDISWGQERQTKERLTESEFT
jgi:hypothetical protein